MADVIRFARSAPVQPAGNSNWRRFPRFEEVGQQIDVQANKLLDVAGSQARYTDLYSRSSSGCVQTTARSSATCSRPSPVITSVSSTRPIWLVCRPATAPSQACRRGSTTIGPMTTAPGGPEGSHFDVPALFEQFLANGIRTGHRLCPFCEVLAPVQTVVQEEHQRALRRAGYEGRARPVAFGMAKAPQDGRFRVALHV